MDDEGVQEAEVPKACASLRRALADCLLASECMQAGHSAKACVSEPLGPPEQCKALLKGWSDCRRGMVRANHSHTPKSHILIYAIQLDMRKRFRGNFVDGTTYRVNV